MKHFELEISQFVDNELFADEQKELFAHLSECEDCRKTLIDFMQMKKESKSFFNELDAELKYIKLPTVQNKKINIYKTAFYISTAAAVLLGVLFFLLQSNNTLIEKNYEMLETKYKTLNTKFDSVNKETITTGVKEKSFVRNKIPSAKNKTIKIVAVNPVKDLSSNTLEDKKFKTSNRAQKIKIVQVTKKDFLTPQIVGN